MEIGLIPFSSTDLPGLLEGILQVYEHAFAGPPYHQTRGDVLVFEGTVRSHAERSGFCGLWACGPQDHMQGFAYGYNGGPGQWWYETVSARLDPAVVRLWMSNYFEFVELAVDPEFQGQGIGGRLHDALLACTRRPTAVLTTAAVETPALTLYRKRGWLVLHENFVFPSDPLPRLIMGKKLDQPAV